MSFENVGLRKSFTTDGTNMRFFICMYSTKKPPCVILCKEKYQCKNTI